MRSIQKYQNLIINFLVRKQKYILEKTIRQKVKSNNPLLDELNISLSVLKITINHSQTLTLLEKF